ncbi:MAG: M3 family metallopeptidase [Usitatibacter sp.]
MRKALLAVLVAALPAAAQPAGPLLPMHDAASIARTCDEALARARDAVATMEAVSGGAGFLAEWNRLQIVLEDALFPIGNLGNLHPDKAVRDAAEPCLQKSTAFNTDLFQSEKLYARVRAIEPADASEAKLKKSLTEGFEDSGVALAPDKRARAKEIVQRLEQIRQAFERAIREDPTTVRYTTAQLAGVPESFLKSRKPEADGTWLLKPDDPTYDAVSSSATDEETRKRMFIARVRRGGESNLALLDEAYRLRQELASLYGLPTYAHYVQRRRMVGSPDVVNKFLAEVKATVAEVEKAELKLLAEARAREIGKPAGAVVPRWDTAYYQNKVRRERFAVDQEKTRKYFPTPRAIDFSMLVAETLYGIKFREGKAPAWHPDVRYFDIHDAASGKFIANIYLDLYPRDGKRGGAWAAGVRRTSTLAGRTPTSVLVTNFNRDGLSHREMETLMHEFGHVLHGVLSTARYASQAGTSVKRDFVEAPSQMFEEWVRREESLALFRKVCAECPALTKEEIARLNEARRFGRGIGYSFQHLAATFDMSLATRPEPPLALWKRLESAQPQGTTDFTLRPASFPHVAGSGYAAGYYGYMWSEVLGLDLLSAFEKNLLDPKVGARYRNIILAQGSQEEEMDMVRKFLGREPNNKAFLEEISGKRQ